MFGFSAELLAMLVIILIASELFTNALENLGQKLGISDGVTGSIFAAVGTALPETSVPLLALLAGTSDVNLNEEIGVGAILGAPLMLSTLSTFLMGAYALKSRGWKGYLKPEQTGYKRDLNFFIAAFLFAAAAMYVPDHMPILHGVISFALVSIYVLYIFFTFRASNKLVSEGHGTETNEVVFLARLGLPNGMPVIVIQLVLGLVLLVGAAKGFIYGVENLSHMLGISALLLSLLIVPIATELPEKINSILWVRKGKDTLAVGNITGAMVFQGTLLPAIGILLTPWQPRPEVLSGIIITLLASIFLRFSLRAKGIPAVLVIVNGILYAIYIVIAVRS